MSRVRIAAGAWSLLCAGLGAWWLLDPSAYVLDDHDGPATSLMTALPAAVGAVLVLVLGLAGVAVAVLLPRARLGGAGRPALVAAAGAVAVVAGIAVPDLQVLSVLGYVLALLGGPVLVAILLLGARGHRRNLLLLAAAAAAVGVGVAAGQIGEPTLRMLEQVRDGLARVGPRPLVLAFMLAGGLLFAALTVSAAGRPQDERSRQRLQRWGRRATVLAALCPLPYALVRMTWLTPWPQGLGPIDAGALDGGMRVFGFSLGLAALGGSWLTLGLISRWGEVWPAWLPGLRGRPVPVLAAVVPASLVALALCASAPSMVALSFVERFDAVVLLIPTPIWGPALALATYAYYVRRTDTAPVTGDDSRARQETEVLR